MRDSSYGKQDRKIQSEYFKDAKFNWRMFELQKCCVNLEHTKDID